MINYIKTNQMRLHPLSVLGYMTAVAILISMLFLASCKHDNEWEEMKAVELAIVGADMKHVGLCDYEAEIPAEGATLIITADGENKEYGYLSRLWINANNDGDAKYMWVSETNVSPDDRMPEGEWGEAYYTSDKVPYSVTVRINPNTGDSARDINLEFGCCYTLSELKITQPASDRN